jgi:hypothetical protein
MYSFCCLRLIQEKARVVKRERDREELKYVHGCGSGTYAVSESIDPLWCTLRSPRSRRASGRSPPPQQPFLPMFFIGTVISISQQGAF